MERKIGDAERAEDKAEATTERREEMEMSLAAQEELMTSHGESED